MAISRIGSGPGLPAGFPFSLTSEANGILFISGMPALDPDGRFVPGTFAEEADRAWANVTPAHLPVPLHPAAGYSAGNFLYVQVVLGDIGDYGEVNDWWRRQFPDPAEAPARFPAHLPFPFTGGRAAR
jgi:2-iminobutanoate/2-iminopropanoate deaminase